MVSSHPGFNEYFEILGEPPRYCRSGIFMTISWLGAFSGIDEGGSSDRSGEEKVDPHSLDRAVLRMQMRGESGVDAMAVIKALAEMRAGSGFSGFVRSTVGPLRKDNIQHSSLIGDWIAQVGFALTGNRRITHNGLFFECFWCCGAWALKKVELF
jgi:hypothetical protein